MSMTFFNTKIKLSHWILLGLILLTIVSIACTKSNSQATKSNDVISSDMKKISSKMFLFSVEKLMTSNMEVYFDQANIYIISAGGIEKQFALDQITAFTYTGKRINNRRVWRVTIQDVHEEFECDFTNNYTLFNSNFKDFYQLLKRKKPELIQKDFRWWRSV